MLKIRRKKTEEMPKAVKKKDEKILDISSLFKPLKILIVSKQNKKGIRESKKLCKALEGKVDLYLEPTTAKRIKTVKKKGIAIKKFDGDLIITVGGDGTLLRAASEAKVPILPAKIEGHGFLCTTTIQELNKNIGKVLNREYRIIERIRLKCSKIKRGKLERYIGSILNRSYPQSLNEIVFARKRPSKILDMEFKLDETVFSFRGDGLLFSTPSGSTGYSASSGGSVIDPSLEVISITPLYPFFSNIKPIIIPLSKKIEVKINGGDCSLIIDGHGGEYVKEENEFIIEKGEPLKIVKISEHNFFERFHEEFIGKNNKK